MMKKETILGILFCVGALLFIGTHIYLSHHPGMAAPSITTQRSESYQPADEHLRER